MCNQQTTVPIAIIICLKGHTKEFGYTRDYLRLEMDEGAFYVCFTQFNKFNLKNIMLHVALYEPHTE